MFKVNKENLITGLLVLWQLISTALVATGVWPGWLAWFNTGLLAVTIAFMEPQSGVVLYILSLPFSLALPNSHYEGFPSWRLLSIWLVFVTILRNYISTRSISTLYSKSVEAVKKTAQWERLGLLFLGVLLLSLLGSRFPVQGLKQIIFLINASLIYLVIRMSVKDFADSYKIIKATAVSLGTIVILGYVQFIITLFSPQYYFWQYWAVFVSKAYYGLGLANVLIYSNSWFSYSGGGQSLRMFSIMPDSHSFGVTALFLIGYLVILYQSFTAQSDNVSASTVHARKRYLYWFLICLAALALIESGTRGIWVGMLVPLVISTVLYWKNIARKSIKPFIAGMLCVIVLFAASPLLDRAFATVRNLAAGGSFLDRVASIYDLSEQSNVGRLEIWQESLVYAVKHPLGTGYGNFIVSLYQSVPDNISINELANQRNTRYNLPQKFITAHSLYLHLLVELGVIGLILFLLFWLSFFKTIWQTVTKHPQQNKTNAIIVVLSGALLWLLAYGVFDVTLFNDKILIYTFITLAIITQVMKQSPKIKLKE